VSSSGCAADAARFAAAMAAAGGWEDCPLVAVALSGGPDSLALALLAAAWAADRGGSALALVLDHRVRLAGRIEAALAAAWAENAGLAVRRLALPPGVAPTAAALRRARHAALFQAAAEAGALHLLVGHHAADQAETVVLRALGGSGERGLGGMAPVRHTGAVRLLRPLLGWTPAEVRNVLRRSGQPWCLDPSNETLGTRAMIRRAMADRDGEGVATRALAAAACARRRAADERARAAASLLARAASLPAAGGVRLDGAEIEGADPVVLADALAGILARLSGRAHAISPAQRAALPGLVAAGRPFTLGGCVVWRVRGCWRVMPERRAVVAVAEAGPVGYAAPEREAPAA
jgi:tRNA(Ile)-lysidine synthase